MSLQLLNAAALAGLAAVALPVAVHLLTRRRARRVVFPTLRFVAAARAAAIRLDTPSDAWLLLLRAAIVGVAALAWAQPLFVTAARQEQREAEIARAVVVDASDSMSPAAARAREIAAAERQGTVAATEIASGTLRDGMREAVAWLAQAPVARHEIVVISDFQHGALSAADLAAVPQRIGLRFSTVATVTPAEAFDGVRMFGAGPVPGRQQRIELQGPHTAVVLAETAAAAEGVQVLGPADEAASADALLRAVAAAGAPAPPSSRPVMLAVAGAAVPRVAAPREAWMIRAIARMAEDDRLQAAAAAVPAGHATTAEPWVAVAHNASGAAIAHAAAAGEALLVQVAAKAEAFVSAAALRALLEAAADPPAWREREVERIPRAQLQQWTREPGAIAADQWKQSAPGDARWMWALVLVLLGVETIVRRRTDAAPVRDEVDRAA